MESNFKSQRMEAYKVLNKPCLLGEGPVWDTKTQTLWWVDILEGVVHRYHPDNETFQQINLNQTVSSIALRENGGCIVTLKNCFAYLDPQNAQLDPIAFLNEDLPFNRFNDGKCDSMGRFWAGTMNMETPINRTGALYLLDTDRETYTMIADTACSNGLAWDIARSKFYFIDTPTRQVVAYDYEETAGKIHNKKTAVNIPPQDGLPDGMTIDKEGMLWVALWDGWGVARYNPTTGECLTKIRLPVAKVTSCTFGGDDLNDLYITTAKVGLTAEELIHQPLAGCTFICPDTPYEGLPATYFKG